MKWMILPALLLSCWSAPGAAADLVAGKYPKVYKGQEGIEVSIVPLQGDEPKNFLVLLKGIESKIDDVVMFFTEEPQGKNTLLYTFIDDKKSYSLHFRDSRWGGRDVLLFLPESPMKEINLWFDEKASKAVDTGAVVNQYKKQKGDGTIAKVESSSTKDWKPYVNGIFKGAVDDAEGPCGGGIGARIDWDTVDKGLYGKIALATMCRRPADTMERLCRNDDKLKLAKKISGITCIVGKKQELSLGSDRRLIWKVPASGDIDLAAMESKLNSLLK
jgi:hypothetical protein